jgi:hypothetical protein
MRRREFIAGLGGAAALPLAARAPNSQHPVVGFLDSASMERNELVGWGEFISILA